MSKTHTTTRVLAAAGLVAMLMISLVPAATAADLGPVADFIGKPGSVCRKSESGGSWNEECRGVSGTCVGTWGAYGTYTEENGKKTYTQTGSYSDVVCA